MNNKEIEIIAKIMLTADGGCLYCACALIGLLAEKFPEHKQTLQNIVSNECEHIIGE